jgi:hypothetical protein
VQESAPTAEKIAAIEAHFQSTHRYDLQAEPALDRGDRSPLRAFLDDARAAHCEYFATASVLLLRALGVPCRLSTGYLVYELNDETDFYQALNRHAHAWAEAYDATSRKWVVVESTPGIRDYIAQFMSTASQQNLEGEGSDAEQAASGLVGWLIRLFRDTTNVLRDALSGPVGWLQLIGSSTSWKWRVKLGNVQIPLSYPMAAIGWFSRTFLSDTGKSGFLKILIWWRVKVKSLPWWACRAAVKPRWST